VQTVAAGDANKIQNVNDIVIEGDAFFAVIFFVVYCTLLQYSYTTVGALLVTFCCCYSLSVRLDVVSEILIAK
jgi:hypothetical protein